MNLRQNVYEITDDTLHWYSAAVQAMQAKDINDPTSWWYQGAMHGYLIDSDTEQFWQVAMGYPPAQATIDSGFWNQCQHATWYFLPWHRMYLYYFEQIVAKTIVDLGGPAGWTLPYWNYCDSVNQNATAPQQQQALQMPPQFGSSTGPNSDYPGLWLEGRRSYTLLERNTNPWTALNEVEFTNVGTDVNFGGGITGFSHFGSKTGQLENLPHNVIHNNIGGAMGDPYTAALDPIFWLHHANIDRLWQVWLDAGRANPDSSQWEEFPFKFHDANGQPAVMIVNQVETTQQLGYRYSPSYPAGEPIDKVLFAARTQPPSDTVGASLKKILKGNQGATMQLEMVPKAFRHAKLAAVHKGLPSKKKSILHIDNVTANGVASPLDVFISSGSGRQASADHLAGTIGLFGIKQASVPSLAHDGSGLSFAIDVSHMIAELRQQPGWDEENISINLVPQFDHQGATAITVGRVSLESELGD